MRNIWVCHQTWGDPEVVLSNISRIESGREFKLGWNMFYQREERMS
jgi:hypothetical protein